MLMWLAQWLQGISTDFGFFRVFQYLTLRAVMAAMTALLIGLIAGPRVIRRLSELKIGQPIRTDGMETHLVKSGTPTMGGVLILMAITVSTLLWARLDNVLDRNYAGSLVVNDGNGRFFEPAAGRRFMVGLRAQLD